MQTRRPEPRRIPLDLRGLGGRDELFRLAGAARRDPSIDIWLTGEPIELRSIARRWFLQMRQCGDDVRELMHDGCPVACVEDAPFGYVNAFKSHVSVGFFHGASIDDPAGLLQGSGKRMRHVKLEPARQPDIVALGDLIAAAYADIKTRIDAERASRSG